LRFLLPSDASALRRRDRVLAILFAAALALLVARAARKDGGVLVRNQEFGGRFLAGQDPYFDPARGHRIHGPYPPSFVLVAAPLSFLTEEAARLAWGAAQAAALLAVFLVLRRWARRWWPEIAPHAPVLFAIALLLASRFLLRDTAGGGGNLLFMTLALLGLDLALRGSQVAAGAPLALSLVLKPNLAPLLLFFAATRRWKVLASASVMATGLFLLPALSFGWGRYLDLAERWAGDVSAYSRLEDLHRADLVPDGMPVPQSATNQSLREAVHRLLRPPGDTGAADVHLAEASAGVASWVARGIALALVLWTCLAASRAPPGRGAALAALAFLPVCLLLSPITWKAHHAALLPLDFALAGSALAKGRWSPLATLLLAYWVLCDLASEEIVGVALRDRLQALSVVTWAAIALLAAAIRLSSREDAAPRPA
jgi:hypothetical protein